MPSLFDPVQVGAIPAANRIFMAPLTRARSSREHVPSDLMPTYYAQRAGAGLIISEAIGISPQGMGWPYAPGLWSSAQIDAWMPVTEAVHQAGGRIVAQPWHMGRLVHPDFLGGAAPVSASATTAPGNAHTYAGKQPYAEARSLQITEIAGIVEDYGRAARHAMRAGFDGVQIHAANGYLIDQFLRDGSNLREDDYGGSPENRIRFLREVVEAVAGEIGADRTGVRLSPHGEVQGVDDSEPASVFVPAASLLSDLGIAFLEVRHEIGPADKHDTRAAIRAAFKQTLILNSGYDFSTAQVALDAGEADAIAFGRAFIANPDLPARFAKGLPLNAGDMKTWYGRGARGYTDYPASA